jgi:hypothetical protein
MASHNIRNNGKAGPGSPANPSGGRLWQRKRKNSALIMKKGNFTERIGKKNTTIRHPIPRYAPGVFFTTWTSPKDRGGLLCANDKGRGMV